MAAALCYGVRGGGAQLAFHLQPGNYNTDTLIQVLAELRRFLGGEKATLLWDGLPAHRSHAMHAWLRRQRSWLVVEPLPGYAPELNPVEPLWVCAPPSADWFARRPGIDREATRPPLQPPASRRLSGRIRHAYDIPACPQDDPLASQLSDLARRSQTADLLEMLLQL